MGLPGARRPNGDRVGAQHHVAVEKRHQGVEVTVPGGSQEGVDQLALTGEIFGGSRRDPGRRSATKPPAGAACQLTGCVCRASDDRSYLAEGHTEEVVQYERQALVGIE